MVPEGETKVGYSKEPLIKLSSVSFYEPLSKWWLSFSINCLILNCRSARGDYLTLVDSCCRPPAEEVMSYLSFLGTG